MTLSAHDENKLTLTNVLRLGEEQAEKLLSNTILLTFDQNDQIVMRLAHHLQVILSRIFSNITTQDTKDASAEIVLGNATERSQALHVFVCFGDGSDVILSENRSKDTSSNVDLHEAFQILTACYASAFVMRRLIGPGNYLLPFPTEVRIDFGALFRGCDFVRNPIDIGKTYLAGAGAIGNAFLYTLQTFDVEGTLFVCDPDSVSGGNLNRCVWVDSSHVGMNKAKTLVLLAQDHFPKLKLKAHEGNLLTLPEKAAGGKWLERLVVAVDSRRARRSLNSEIPREVYDASTTDIREVFLHFSRRPNNGLACLECAYHLDVVEKAHELHVARVLGLNISEIEQLFISQDAAIRISSRYPNYRPAELEGQSYDTLFKELCGKGSIISKNESQVLAPFAFVSVFAGALLAIEFVHRISDGFHQFNSFRASPWSSPVLRLQQQVMTNSKCSFCNDATKSVFAERLWQ